jgi:hypothetical protein
VQAHAGNTDGSRPVITRIDPAVPGLAATAVFAGDWQISLSVVSGQHVEVLDENGRPFLRIGPGGVDGDYGAPAWYASAVTPKLTGALRLPQEIGPGSAPDWRAVSRGTTWAWFDPRIKSEPGTVTPQMAARAARARLRDFAVPLRVGDGAATILGYLEFEPPRGVYHHTMQSPERLAAGVEVGLLEGQAVPTITVKNNSDKTVTALGQDGEPFLRVGTVVEANLGSPTWVIVGRSMDRLPKQLADSTAKPTWEKISEGRLMSWPDFRSRPPDSEPQVMGVRPGSAIVVRRWSIPLRIEDQAVEVRGTTEFVTFGTGRPAEHSVLPASPAAAVIAAIAALASLGYRRRRGLRA